MPNRATLATGRWPSAHGVRQNGIPLPLNATTFVDLLRAADFHTGLIGKLHLQNITSAPSHQRSKPGRDQQLDPPPELSEAVNWQRTSEAYRAESLEAWRNEPHREIVTPFYGFDHVRICSGDGDMVEGHYTAWLADQIDDPNAIRGPDAAIPDDSYSAPQAYRTRMPEELYPTRYIERESIAFLNEHVENCSGQPFYLQCSFPNPHHPFTPPGRYWDKYRPEDVSLPASFHANEEGNLPPVEGIVEGYERGKTEPEGFWPVSVTERHAKELIALTYGMITMIDDAVGAVVKSLEELGLADNTILIFTSDHGDYMGDQGMVLKLGLHRSSIIRVPFVWCDPTRPTSGIRDGRLSGTVDIAATILDRVGLRPYHGMQGKSLLNGDDIRDGMVIEDFGVGIFRDPDSIAGMLTFVTETWRMGMFEGTNWGELYNLREDPHELNNLWDNSDHQTIKMELQERLIHQMIGLRDRAISPTGQA